MKNIRDWFSKIQPQSLRYQLLSRTMLILASLLLLIGLVQYFLLQQFLYRSQADSLESRIRAVPIRAWEAIIQGENRDIRNVLNTFQERGITVAFIDTTGIMYPIMISVPFENESDAPQITQLPKETYLEALSQRKKKRDYHIMQSKKQHHQLIVLSSLDSRNSILGLIQVTFDTRLIDHTLTRALWTFIIGALVALTAGLFTYLATLRKSLGPLTQIMDRLDQTNVTILNERLPENLGQEEINKLAISYNAMLARIEDSFFAEKEARESMRRFVADASHELRTPLTSIHGFLEVLLRGAAKKPEQLDQALNSMYRESERITKLVNDLLLLAKFDRKPQISKQSTRLGEIIRDMENQLHLLADRRQLSIHIIHDAQLQADVDRIKQVILNLFQNAVEHTDSQSGKIDITVDNAGDYAVFHIQDNGHGIHSEHLPHIFDRFYREESSRTRQSGGAGLGLAIVKSIIDLHHGEIEVVSQVQVGTTFTVKLPRNLS